MVKRNDEVRFVNFEHESRPRVREFMDKNRNGTFTVDGVYNAQRVTLKGVNHVFKASCVAKPRFKVGDNVRLSLSNISYVVTGISSNVIGGRIHYIVREVFGTCEKVVSEYDLAFFEDNVEVSAKKDVETTLTQVDVRGGERLVAILYLRPEELHLVIPMLTESYDNVSFRRIDAPPF